MPINNRSLIGVAAICLSSLGCNPDAHESDIQNLKNDGIAVAKEYDYAVADFEKRQTSVSEDVKKVMNTKFEICETEMMVCQLENVLNPLCDEANRQKSLTFYKERIPELKAEISGQTPPKSTKNSVTAWIEGACEEKTTEALNLCRKQNAICVNRIR